MLLKLARDQLQNTYGRLLSSRADGLWHKGNLPKAEVYFRAAIKANARNALAYSNLGAVLMELHRYDEGFSMLVQAANLDALHPGILVNLGNAYYRSGRLEQAIDKYQEALEIDPGNVGASTNLVRPLMEVCNWDALDRHLERIKLIASENGSDWLRLISPYNSLFLPVTRREQLLIAQRAALEFKQEAAKANRRIVARNKSRSKRIRIAYLSSDFHDHATAHLTLGIYGKHDRSRFEIYAYSIGHPDSGLYRQKIMNNCDKFVDVHDQSSQEIAMLIAKDQIDILIDLKGYTGWSRPGILALRPAPIQVNYLGYPGTMGADFIDYLIADAVIIPASHSEDYSEQIIRLPDSYQPTDNHQHIAETPNDRVSAGLPHCAFVFCCFNTPAKIDRRSFSCWMRILALVPDSVLWLLQIAPEVQHNLANAARSANVNPARIVYGPPLPKSQHLARLRLADLVLDTFHYNAHTTATDALWSGVPIVTLTGSTFASRVATSLLSAVGLSSLATDSEEDFIELSVKLASDKNRLKQFRNDLFMNKRKPLFDTDLYVKNLEKAYQEMYAQGPK